MVARSIPATEAKNRLGPCAGGLAEGHDRAMFGMVDASATREGIRFETGCRVTCALFDANVLIAYLLSRDLPRADAGYEGDRGWRA